MVDLHLFVHQEMHRTHMLVVGPNVVVRGHGSSDVYFIVAGFF